MLITFISVFYNNFKFIILPYFFTIIIFVLIYVFFTVIDLIFQLINFSYFKFILFFIGIAFTVNKFAFSNFIHLFSLYLNIIFILQIQSFFSIIIHSNLTKF